MIFIIKNPAKNLQVPQTESKKRTAIEQQQIDLFMGYVKNSERYSYTSLAYSAGADVKIVSQNLGHASTSVTLDTYTHLTEDKKKEQEAVRIS